MYKYFIVIILTLGILLFPKVILASDRNIFGLHLTQTSDIDDAAKIVNSNGGDWGWATIVIRTDQLDYQTWQDFFNKCRKYHIIPIIRLATINQNGVWKKPEYADIDNLANFLNSLNWPTLDQHIILFNEVNHAQEWGGTVDPKSYTDISIYAIQKFKSLNSHFILLSAGLDLAAPQKLPDFESAENFINVVTQYNREYWQQIDGIASHSYPNHGFVGTPNDSGEHSILGYQWELATLKNFGITKNFPVYITETGWPHREGESNNNIFYTTTTTASFLIDALSKWQKDDRVVAVTPFIFNYPYAPFDHFSWIDKSEIIYPAYQKVIDLPKNANQPEQLFKYISVKIQLPLFMFPNNEYSGQLILKNEGQSIWGEKKSQFCLIPQASSNITLDSLCSDDQQIVPGQTETFSFKFKLGSQQENSFLSWQGLPHFEINSVLPMITNAQIYRPENGIIDRIKRFYYEVFK